MRRIRIAAPLSTALFTSFFLAVFFAPLGASAALRIQAPSFGPRLNAQLQEDGVERLLVLRVDFSDQPGRRPREELDMRLFDEETASAAAYYEEVSYGQLTIEPGPLGGSAPLSGGWYRMPREMGYYGQGQTAQEPRYRELAEQALDAALADAALDLRLSDYDRDGDGALDHLVVLHAGNDRAATNREGDIWSVLLPNMSIVRQGVQVESAALIAEDPDAENPRVGIWCHELAHSFGAPETYGSLFGVTPNDTQFCLMGRFGAYQGGGLSPAHLCGYLKWDLDGDPDNGRSGWIEPVELEAGGGPVEIGALSNPGGAPALYKIEVPNRGGREFFLIENRSSRAGARFDGGLPDEGLLIWRIDESAPVFGHTIAPRIWLEDPGDPLHERLDEDGYIVTQDAAYSAEDGQTAYTPRTRPGSNAADGTPTGLSIVSVSESGPRMRFHVFFGESFEPNNEPGTAYPILLNQAVQSALEAERDVDHYRFAAPGGVQLLVEAAPIEEGARSAALSLSLLDAGGSLLAEAFPADGSAALQLRYFNPQPAELTARLEPLGWGGEPVEYRLMARVEEGSGAAPRLAAFRIYPNPAPYGAPIRALAALDRAPIDWAQAQIYSAYGARLDQLELHSPSGDALFIFQRNLPPGVYFLRLSVEQGGQSLRRIGKFAVK